MKNMDSTLLFCFITAANKEFIEHLKKSIEEIDKIVIYKPILLSDLRRKVNLLLSEKN
ncbi:MAG TPA: hypothetical protein VLA48_07570 [Nitrososphaeraceae archaeon]|nr:hypothetical protein [Nitrososphaeraceae archaeon]